MIPTDVLFDNRGCGHRRPLIHVTSTTTSCGHCGKLVYPDVVVLRHHTFTRDGEVVTWYAHDLEVQVHRCGEEATADLEAELTELLSTTGTVGQPQREPALAGGAQKNLAPRLGGHRTPVARLSLQRADSLSRHRVGVLL